MAEEYRSLRWILGDQLNENHSWFKKTDDSVLFVIAELYQETAYTRHHIQKLTAFFAAMSAFADRLRELGHQVLYLNLELTAKYSSLEQLIGSTCDRYRTKDFYYQRPDEYRLLQQFRNLKLTGFDIIESDSEHFLLPFHEIEHYFTTNKPTRMETFYRKFRRRYSILMDDGNPLGGQWNYDKENRNRLKQKDLDDIPKPLLFNTPAADIVERLRKHRVKYIGSIGETLTWPVTRAEALKLLHFFCQQCLPQFGYFQDALTGRSDYGWSLYHSRLSFALNTKLLSPLEVIEQAIKSFHASDGIDLAQVEGFVRQILGWREFIRGLYWANMPEYASKNYFHAENKLPAFFWTGGTRMRCLEKAITQSLEHAYAHHIQRLMVTGNFCLLTGIDPKEVDQWYLGIYLDAIEWVELPNTRGMALFADGGLVGTKPYAAGGNYINKMSDYCNDCHYKIKKKLGPSACPLNSLYWNFMSKHRSELEKNHRLRMLYTTWDRMGSEMQQSIIKQANEYLADLDRL